MSIRADIQNAIVTILQGITKANDYNNDVALVTRRQLKATDLTSFPALAVVSGPARKQQSSEDGKLYEVIQVFGIYGFQTAESDPDRQGLLDDAAQALMEDIEDALLAADASLTTAADSEAALTFIESEEPYLNYDKNVAEIQVVFAVKYYHDTRV